jgi:hypothetical protein
VRPGGGRGRVGITQARAGTRRGGRGLDPTVVLNPSTLRHPHPHLQREIVKRVDMWGVDMLFVVRRRR